MPISYPHAIRLAGFFYPVPKVTLEVEKMEKETVNVNEILKKPYLDEREAAVVSTRAVSTLRNDRHLRRGIPYLKVGGRSVRYKIQDVLRFMEARRISFEQE